MTGKISKIVNSKFAVAGAISYGSPVPNIRTISVHSVTIQPSNSVYAVNATTGTLIANISVESYARDVVVNPTNGMVYVFNQGSDSVSVIDGSTNKVVATVPVGRNPVEIAVNPRTDLLYVPDELSHELSIIDGSRNAVVADVTMGCMGPCTNSTSGVPNSVDVDPSSNTVYVASNGIDSLQVMNGFSNELMATSVLSDPQPRPRQGKEVAVRFARAFNNSS